MKQDKDWIDAVRQTLRDAEAPLPEGGWERLSRKLPAAAPRKPFWMRRWPKYAAAAAVVLICLAVGDAYWRASRQEGTDIPAIAVVVPESAGTEVPVQPETPAVEEAVATVTPVKRDQGVRAARKVRVETEIYELADRIEPTPESGSTSEPEYPDDVSSIPAESPVTRSGVETSGKQSPQAQTKPQRSFAETDPFAEPLPKRQGGSALFGVKVGGSPVSGGKQNGLMPTALVAIANKDESVYDQPALIPLGTPMRINFAECTYAHKQPLSFALTAGKQFPYGLSLESGISYTLLRSEVTVPLSSGEVEQSLHMLGIPVRLNWNWLNRGGFSLYLSGGGLAEKCIAARFGGEKYQEKSVQFSVFGALGAQYNLGKHVGLYFEPEVSYYFTETILRTSRTDTPVSFTLQLGVRLFY